MVHPPDSLREEETRVISICLCFEGGATQPSWSCSSLLPGALVNLSHEIPQAGKTRYWANFHSSHKFKDTQSVRPGKRISQEGGMPLRSTIVKDQNVPLAGTKAFLV